MARNVVLSVRDTLEGYYITPRIINENWGFQLRDICVAEPGPPPSPPATLALSSAADVPRSLPGVVVVGALRDHLAPIAMQRWVAAQVPGALMVEMAGNHIAGITALLPLVAAMIRGIEERSSDCAAQSSHLPTSGCQRNRNTNS
jgi:hypothetical protein